VTKRHRDEGQSGIWKSRFGDIKSNSLPNFPLRPSKSRQNHTMMKENQVNPSRPPTVWVDQSAFFHEHASSNPIPSPDIQPLPSQKMTAAAISLSLKKSLPDRPKQNIPQLNQNPWDTFEPVAASSQDRSLIFARHKTMKGELVHIQQLKQQFSPATVS
jgi:hypothetical protein